MRPGVAIRQSDHPPPEAPLDVRNLLGRTRIEAIAVDAQPLDTTVRAVAQVAGVPVYFDLLAMDVAGTRLDTPVTDRMGARSCGNMLRDLAQAAGCEIDLQEGFLQIQPSGTKLGEALVSAFTVDDLAEIADLPARVRLLLGPVPEGTKIGLAGNALEVEADRATRLRIAVLLHGLRRALEIPSDQKALDRWLALPAEGAAAQRAADWAPLPDAPVGFNSDFAMPVEMILGRLARETDSALAMDWPACWSHGLTATSQALPWYRNRQIHQVVAQLLEPYVLTARDSGGGVWWVGTAERYQQMRIAGIVDTALDEASARQRIAAAAGQSPDQVPAMRLPGGRRWLVYLPRYVVRELPSILED
jgi:hypothetical protein